MSANPPTGSPVLETVAVTKSFGGVHALSGVDFSLEPGEIHTLVGENGAGKSTLIKVLTGVYTPDAGEVRFAGEPVHFRRPSDAQDAGISTIYQEVNLVPLLSVARNIFLGREPRNRIGLIDVKRMNRDAHELLGRLGVPIDVTAELGRLGLGAQQMVALARAMSVDSRVVIMDEPTSSLERKEVDTLFGVARGLRDQGVGLVFVSHRLDELWELCDRVTILRDGERVHSGTMANLDRVSLVSHMLGRDVGEVERSGATKFGDSHAREREPVLVAEGINAQHRLHDVDLSVAPGEIVGLGGLLGSGRSETVKAIYGALHTRGGQVRVGGKRLKSNSVPDALRNGVALLSEDRKAEGIVGDLTVAENIVRGIQARRGWLRRVTRSEQDAVVTEYMSSLAIRPADPTALSRNLSGGNQQKVLLARWLATAPRLLILDEPTRGIDVGAKADIQRQVADLAAAGLSVIFISSELEEVVRLAQRIVVMRDRRKIGELLSHHSTVDDVVDFIAQEGRERVS
jgi:ribose transport system ATP-binding protein